MELYSGNKVLNSQVNEMTNNRVTFAPTVISQAAEMRLNLGEHKSASQRNSNYCVCQSLKTSSSPKYVLHQCKEINTDR